MDNTFGTTNNFLDFNRGVPLSPVSPISYKPITFEKLSSFAGTAFTLSSLENINTISSPRGGEQQILFVNNDDKIYVRNFDNSMGIIGYKESYVQGLEKELEEAQSQLQQIFQELTSGETSEPLSMPAPIELERIEKIEMELAQLRDLLTNLVVKEDA